LRFFSHVERKRHGFNDNGIYRITCQATATTRTFYLHSYSHMYNLPLAACCDYIEFQTLSESAALHILESIPRLTALAAENPRLLFFSIKYISPRRFHFRERTLLARNRCTLFIIHVACVQDDCFVQPFGLLLCRFADNCSRDRLVYLYKFKK